MSSTKPESNPTSEKTLSNYECFYLGKRISIQAETSFKAQQSAAEQLKVPLKKQYMITVVPVADPGAALS